MSADFLYGLIAGIVATLILLAMFAVLPHGHNHCGLCGDRFPTLEALEDHLRVAHGKEAS